MTRSLALSLSLLGHTLLFLIFTVSLNWHKPLYVVKNSDEVIQALLWEEKPLPSKTIQALPKARPVMTKPEPVVSEKKVEMQTQAIIIPKKNIVKKDIPKPQTVLKKKDNKEQQKAIQMAFEKEMQEIKEKALQENMLKEQKILKNLRAQQMQGVVDKYKALILQAISQNWLIPPDANKKLFAELLIHLAPGGVVLNVKLTKTSGDTALDRSALAAVLKASPLPVPDNREEFEAFRQFVLRVRPENIITAS